MTHKTTISHQPDRPKNRKPLIHWCRWHDCTLRIMGKEGDLIFGEVVHHYDDSRDPFRYHPRTWILTVGDKTVQLDEMGIEIEGEQLD